MVEYVLSSSPGDKMDGRYRNGGYVSQATNVTTNVNTNACLAICVFNVFTYYTV